MNICSTGDIREKEIINLCDGMRLGYATDFEINVCDARIVALIVPQSGGLFGLPKGDGLVIPWERIECIGEDTILVKVDPGELRKCGEKDKGKRKNCKFLW